MHAEALQHHLRNWLGAGRQRRHRGATTMCAAAGCSAASRRPGGGPAPGCRLAGVPGVQKVQQRGKGRRVVGQGHGGQPDGHVGAAGAPVRGRPGCRRLSGGVHREAAAAKARCDGEGEEGAGGAAVGGQRLCAITDGGQGAGVAATRAAQARPEREGSRRIALKCKQIKKRLTGAAAGPNAGTTLQLCPGSRLCPTFCDGAMHCILEEVGGAADGAAD